MNENVTNPDPPRWPWPDSLDALAAAPQYHELVIENARVRVLNVCIAPGQIVPVHTHRWPSVVYTLSAGDFVRRDGHGKVLFDTRTAPRPSVASVVMWLGALATSFGGERGHERDSPVHRPAQERNHEHFLPSDLVTFDQSSPPNKLILKDARLLSRKRMPCETSGVKSHCPFLIQHWRAEARSGNQPSSR